MRLISILATALLVAQATAITSNRYRIIDHPDPVKRKELQDVVCDLLFATGG